MGHRVQEIDAHFSHHELIQIREHPNLRPAIFRLARLGRLACLLPGIYARTDHAHDPRIRMAALHLKDPGVVFTGLSAAGLLWDSQLLPPTVEAVGRLSCAYPGFDVRRRRIDPDWISELNGGIRVTNPALTAIDLIPQRGGRFVDQLLRDAGAQGPAVLEHLWSALRAHPHRPGNHLRAELLALSRGLPWSEAERVAHRHLRQAGITGWLANSPIVTPTATYAVDMVFPAIGLIIEFDGFEFHSTRAAFERDRTRHNALVTAGWQLLHFTWAMIETGSWMTDLKRFLEHHPDGHLVLP